jgi:hypothetical protein
MALAGASTVLCPDLSVMMSLGSLGERVVFVVFMMMCSGLLSGQWSWPRPVATQADAGPWMRVLEGLIALEYRPDRRPVACRSLAEARRFLSRAQGKIVAFQDNLWRAFVRWLA